jgi:hypothetical protein
VGEIVRSRKQVIMSDQFVGLTMLVTLNYPPDAQLRGKVFSVVAGKSLTLRDGMSFSLLASKSHIVGTCSTIR